MENIGVGLITYNSTERLVQSSKTVPTALPFVIVNDGTPYDPAVYPNHAEVIQHEKNQGVAAAKNSALKWLMDKGCEHLFLMEDDILIKDPTVFDQYIKLAEETGIRHFNYALHGPMNKRLPYNSFEKFIYGKYPDLANKLARQRTKRRRKGEDRATMNDIVVPDPIRIISYGDTSLALYHHCVGAFSYFHRSVIQEVGYMDARFVNALEHVEHTLRIVKASMHPPFWYFADLADSSRYLDEIPGSIEASVIAKTPNLSENQITANSLFENLYDMKASKIHKQGIRKLMSSLSELKSKKEF